MAVRAFVAFGTARIFRRVFCPARHGIDARWRLFPVPGQLLAIEFDAQSRPIRNGGHLGAQWQRLGDQVGLVIQRADQVGRVPFAVDRLVGHRQVQHRGGGDSQFQVAAHRADDPRLSGHLGDPPHLGQATVLAGVNGQDVGCLVADQLHGVGDGETALVGHDRDVGLFS